MPGGGSDQFLKYTREEDRPEKALFVITTDGMEVIFETVSKAACNFRAGCTMTAGWKRKIDADFKKRGK